LHLLKLLPPLEFLLLLKCELFLLSSQGFFTLFPLEFLTLALLFHEALAFKLFLLLTFSCFGQSQSLGCFSLLTFSFFQLLAFELCTTPLGFLLLLAFSFLPPHLLLSLLETLALKFFSLFSLGLFALLTLAIFLLP
jgi:hypothetical protein